MMKFDRFYPTSHSLNKNSVPAIPILDSPGTHKTKSGMLSANETNSQALGDHINDRSIPLPKLFLSSFFGVIEVSPPISSNL